MSSVCYLVVRLFLYVAFRVDSNKIQRKIKTVCAEILSSIEGHLHVNRTVVHTGGTCIHVFTVKQCFRKGVAFKGVDSSGCLQEKKS